MSGRQRTSGSAFPPSNMPRQNEYFVPRDGIDREVITSDICRYLGNDALVRPGTHQDQETGRLIQGYFITAYRNLTTAMIVDLKTDSARWEAERRKYGAVRYQDSQIRDTQRPMASGAGGAGGYAQSSYPSAREMDGNARYPGSDAPGYSASGPGANPFGLSGGAGGYQYSQGTPSPSQYTTAAPQPPQDPRYPASGAAAAVPAQGYGGASVPRNTSLAADGYMTGSNYHLSVSRDMYPMDMPMSDAPVAPARRTSPPSNNAFANPGQGSLGGAPYGNVSGGAPGYSSYSLPAASASIAQPIDFGYGRKPTTANPGYGSPQELQQAQQYEDPPVFPPSPSRTGPAATSSNTQITSSGTSGPSRRDRERIPSERADHRDRDRDRERIGRNSDRDRDLDRDNTPPNRTGSAQKTGSSSHHHYGGRR